MSSTRLTLLIVAMALLGAVAPAVALQADPGQAAQPSPTATPTDANESTAVDVRPGAQLSTVLTATAIVTRGEIEDTRLELELERGDDDERARALAERAERLAERATEIRQDYEIATAAHQSGELSAESYARELAALNARAEALLDDVEALRGHARNLSGLELEAAGFNRSALRAAAEELDPLTGVGPSSILQRFLGESTGEVELTTDAGLRVEVEGEPGEASLEVRRPRDDDHSMTVSQEAALQTARPSLPPGDWSLAKASVHPDSGYHKFEFDLRAANRTGEAEVRVDGSSGQVFRLEVETETADEDDERGDAEERDDEGEDHDLALLLVNGTPAPNATITVRAVANGEPVANVTVTVNGEAVAETDATGDATITLPRAAEVELRAGDGELEFEFDEAAHERGEVFRQLHATAALEDGVVTLQVTFDGEPVTGAAVFANDRRVGETGADGGLRFDFDATETDELELELVKGEFEAELEFEVADGELSLTEAAHEGDDEVDEGAEEDDEADTPEAEEEDDEAEEEPDTPEAEDDEEPETPEAEDDEGTETPEVEEEDDEDDEDEEETDTPDEDDDDDSSGSG